MGIFDLANRKEAVQQPTSSDIMTADIPVVVNPDAIQENETYNHYGIRVCGKVVASNNALQPFLQRIYLSEKNRQAGDAVLQEKLRQEKLLRMNELDTELQLLNGSVNGKQQAIKDCDNNILEIKERISVLRNGSVEDDRMARMRMIIGMVILVPLTVYLFIFYSSTFYSAFFRDFSTGNIGIGDAMFDPQALPNAFSNGFGELIFVLFAPIIFMGLGFTLHTFSLQKGVGKYLKTGTIILVTFIFDCILAYSIAKRMWDIYIQTHSVEADVEYTLGQAITDEHVWAVIFCGFVAYIIWGLVFDMTMGAYERRVSNKSPIEQQELKLAAESERKRNMAADLAALEKEVATNRGEKNALNIMIASNTVSINNDAIKVCLSDFFTGWLQQMNTLMCSQERQKQAGDIYGQTITVLFQKA